MARLERSMKVEVPATTGTIEEPDSETDAWREPSVARKNPSLPQARTVSPGAVPCDDYETRGRYGASGQGGSGYGGTSEGSTKPGTPGLPSTGPRS